MRKRLSYSKKIWYELDISIEKVISEIRHTTINFTTLTEWPKIHEWATKVEEWRASNIGHEISDGCKIGIYGELFAATLIIRNVEDFDKWLFTMAIVGNGDNTNRDLISDWTNVEYNIECKTVSKFNDRIRIETPLRKTFEYPESMLAIKELDTHVYNIHSLTKKSILENVVKIYPGIDGGIARIFRLNDLNPVKPF